MRYHQVGLSDVDLGVLVTALSLAREQQVFVDPDGHDDAEQIAAADELLRYLRERRQA